MGGLHLASWAYSGTYPWLGLLGVLRYLPVAVAEGGHCMSPQGCWRPSDGGRVGPLIKFCLFACLDFSCQFFSCSVLSLCSCCVVLVVQLVSYLLFAL